MDIKSADLLSFLSAIVPVIGTAVTIIGGVATAYLRTINKSTHWQNRELEKQSRELHELRTGVGRLSDHMTDTRVTTSVLQTQHEELRKDINAAFERIRGIETGRAGGGRT